MAFFDFLGEMGLYRESPISSLRMNARHEFLIAPFRDEIRGARVFDIAAHDGRWAYAFADAGAREVIGVEARPELIAEFAGFPDATLRKPVTLLCNDLFDELDQQAARGETYDVVGVFGILYHVMDHFRLLKAVQALKPRLVLVDGEFIDRPNPMIQMAREKTEKILNAAPQIKGQEVAAIGIPSFKALELMADVLGYDVAWADWNSLPADRRTGVQDYFRTTGMRRGTCALRPRPQAHPGIAC